MIPIGFLEFGIKDFIETLIIASVLVYLYRWIRGTFAIQATIGIIVVILINFFIRLLGFSTINFILKSILDVGILAVFILFQPEIRKLLYRLGNNTSFDRFFSRADSSEMIDEGAVVIRNNRIVAASCYLPISQNPNIAQAFGTRHRAAVGISETNNVLVLVVSEETGRVSIARNGILTSGLTIQKLRAEMEEAFGTTQFDEEMTFGSAQNEMKLK